MQRDLPPNNWALGNAWQILRDAQLRPWAHGFMPLLRRLAASQPCMPRVGCAQRPQQETYRLGQLASLAFAPRELARVEVRSENVQVAAREAARFAVGECVTGPYSVGVRGTMVVQPHRVHIKLFGLGILGPNGSLPIHVTELVRERTEAKRDSTLADFLDLFHHRAFTHVYRAWAQSQSAAGLDRKDDETFTPYIARLAGDEAQAVQHSALAPHARWASAAHRVRAARNPEGLVRTLAHYFGVPVRMQEFCMQWMAIEPEDRCVLGQARQSSVLGQGALLGDVVPDRQTRFRLVIGALDLDGYLRLTPQGVSRPDGRKACDLGALIELVRSFVGFEYIWEVELLLDRRAAPASRLGDSTQLGWSGWLGGQEQPDQTPISGMLFEPEYFAQAQATLRKQSSALAPA